LRNVEKVQLHKKRKREIRFCPKKNLESNRPKVRRRHDQLITKKEVLFSTEVAAMVTENFRKKSWGGVVESFKANAKKQQN